MAEISSLEQYKKLPIASRLQDEHSRNFTRKDEDERTELEKRPFKMESLAKATDPNQSLSLLLPDGETKVVSNKLVSGSEVGQRPQDKERYINREATDANESQYLGAIMSENSGYLVESYIGAVISITPAAERAQVKKRLAEDLEHLGYTFNEKGALVDQHLDQKYQTDEERKAEDYRLRTYRLAYLLESITPELRPKSTATETKDQTYIVRNFINEVLQGDTRFRQLVKLPKEFSQVKLVSSMDSADILKGLRYGLDHSYNEYIDTREQIMQIALEQMNLEAATMSANFFERLSGPALNINERVVTDSEADDQKVPEGSEGIVVTKTEGKEVKAVDVQRSFLRDTTLASRYMLFLLPPEFVAEEENLKQLVIDANQERQNTPEARLKIQAAKRNLFEHQQIGRLAVMRSLGLREKDQLLEALVRNNPNAIPGNEAKMTAYLDNLLTNNEERINGTALVVAERRANWGGTYGDMLQTRMGQLFTALGISNVEVFAKAISHPEDYPVLLKGAKTYKARELAAAIKALPKEKQSQAIRLLRQAQRYAMDERSQRQINQDKFIDEFKQVVGVLDITDLEINEEKLRQELITLRTDRSDEDLNRATFTKDRNSQNSLAERLWSRIRTNPKSYDTLAAIASRNLAGVEGKDRLESLLMRLATGRDEGVWERVIKDGPNDKIDLMSALNPNYHAQDALKGLAYLVTAQATEVLPDEQQTADRFAVVIVEDMKSKDQVEKILAKNQGKPKAERKASLERKEVKQRGKNLSIRPLKDNEAPKPIAVVRVAGKSAKDPEQGLFYEYTPTKPAEEGTGSDEGSGTSDEPPADPDLPLAPVDTSSGLVDATTASGAVEPSTAPEPTVIVDEELASAAEDPAAKEALEAASRQKVAALLGLSDFQGSTVELLEQLGDSKDPQAAYFTEGNMPEERVLVVPILTITPENLATVKEMAAVLGMEVNIDNLVISVPKDQSEAFNLDLSQIKTSELLLTTSAETGSEEVHRVNLTGEGSLRSLSVEGNNKLKVNFNLSESGYSFQKINIGPNAMLEISYPNIPDHAGLMKTVPVIEVGEGAVFMLSQVDNNVPLTINMPGVYTLEENTSHELVTKIISQPQEAAADTTTEEVATAADDTAEDAEPEAPKPGAIEDDLAVPAEPVDLNLPLEDHADQTDHAEPDTEELARRARALELMDMKRLSALFEKDKADPGSTPYTGEELGAAILSRQVEEAPKDSVVKRLAAKLAGFIPWRKKPVFLGEFSSAQPVQESVASEPLPQSLPQAPEESISAPVATPSQPARVVDSDLDVPPFLRPKGANESEHPQATAQPADSESDTDDLPSFLQDRGRSQTAQPVVSGPSQVPEPSPASEVQPAKELPVVVSDAPSAAPSAAPEPSAPPELPSVQPEVDNIPEWARTWADTAPKASRITAPPEPAEPLDSAIQPAAEAAPAEELPAADPAPAEPALTPAEKLPEELAAEAAPAASESPVNPTDLVGDELYTYLAKNDPAAIAEAFSESPERVIAALDIMMEQANKAKAFQVEIKLKEKLDKVSELVTKQA